MALRLLRAKLSERSLQALQGRTKNVPSVQESFAIGCTPRAKSRLLYHEACYGYSPRSSWNKAGSVLIRGLRNFSSGPSIADNIPKPSSVLVHGRRNFSSGALSENIPKMGPDSKGSGALETEKRFGVEGQCDGCDCMDIYHHIEGYILWLSYAYLGMSICRLKQAHDSYKATNNLVNLVK